MSKKLLDYAGLQKFLNRIKGLIPTKTSELQNDSGFITSEGTYDDELSLVSEQAVQNKVVTAAINSKQATLSTAQTNAVDSGITSAKVQGYDSHISDTDIHVTAADKANWDSKAAGTHTHIASDVSGLSTVATSGSYNDLSNKPSIPSKTSDLTNDSGFLTSHNPVDSALSSTSTNAVQNKAVKAELDNKANSADLATVATSGSYNDLTNKPTIPTVNNATLTIQKNGTTVKTFTANASSNVTADITVPTKVSELTNDSGFLTAHNPVDSALSDTSANAVQNKVVKGALDGKSDTGHTHTASEVSGLATVATSGSYNDLSNKPTIPTVNNATLTIQKNGATVKTFTANASSNVTANITVPTNVSELTNDSGYLTSSSSLDSSKLTGTIDIARLPKGALERLVTVANQTARFALTTSDVQLGDTVKQLDTGVMYIVTDESKLSSADGYTEYTAGAATSVPWSGVTGKPSSYTPASHSHGNIANGGTLGTASRALITDGDKKITTSSVTSTELGYLSGVTSAIQTQLNGKASSSHTHTASEVSGLSTVATSGSYNDLSNKPTIPTVNNATLTIQKNGTTVKTFTANASSNVTANITVPTKTSELTNDSHQTITVGTDTTSTASPAHSGTFTCIDSVTRDSNGHVTAVNTKTVTLPSDNNTDTLVTQNVSTANENHPVLLTVTKDATANQGAKTSIFASGVKVNPSTNTVTATTFSGALSGNASTATQFSANKSVTLTGDVTGTASSKAGWSVATTLSDSGVTAGTYGPSADVTGNNNATISVPEITVDSKGRVTSVANRTLTCKNNTYSVYNKTLTIQKNGTNVATFTSNSNTDVTANITVPTKVSELTNDSGYLTSHQSLANYSTLANTIKSLSISGKTITYTKGDNTTGTLTTQDTNTDTLMTQNVSTANATYPVLLTATADATANQGAKTGIFAKSVKVNPSTNVISASGFSGPLTGNVTGNCSGSSGSCTGNAATATQFSANKSVTLTGDVTGTASSKAGWSVATTLANSGVTAGSYGPSAAVSPTHGGTFSVPYITVDAKGRVTAASSKTITLPADSNTDTKVTQTVTTGNSYYPVILGYTEDQTATETSTARFSKGFLVNARYSFLYIRNTYNSENTKGVRGTSTYTNALQIFQCYDGTEMGRLFCESNKGGYTRVSLRATNYVTDGAISPTGSAVNNGLSLDVKDDGTKLITIDGNWNSNLTPATNNSKTLGTSSLKWKAAYAVNFYENGTALSSLYQSLSDAKSVEIKVGETLLAGIRSDKVTSTNVSTGAKLQYQTSIINASALTVFEFTVGSGTSGLYLMVSETSNIPSSAGTYVWLGKNYTSIVAGSNQYYVGMVKRISI